MIICGIKITHDGGIALIENGKLIFSIELEKINNNHRYAGIADLAEIKSLLQSKGYRMDQIDLFVVDGWHGSDDNWKGVSHITVPTDGTEIKIPVAYYNEENLADDNTAGQNYSEGLLIDQISYPYQSFRHVTGHILGAYCTSPFSASAEDSYVLVWDGGQYPRLYYINAAEKTIVNKGPLFFLMGTIYGIMGQYFGPYKKTAEALAEDRKEMELNGYFGGLSVAGKIMSYIAEGSIDHELLKELPELYKSVFEISNLFEHKFCQAIQEFTADKSCTDADILLTIHSYLQNLLIQSLSRKIAADGYAESNFCFCGGSALNIKWNSAIRASGIFKEIYIPPFPNDSGSAIGTACAAMWANTDFIALKWNVYSGPSLIESELAENGWKTEACNLKELAMLLHQTEEPVVFLSGCAEIGPRALGNRSLLAIATKNKIKDCLNEVKQREAFRPVAPICLQEDAADIFDPGCADPYMLFEHQVQDSWKDRVPAICHLDGSARLQSVAADSPAHEIRTLLEEYKKISGIPLLCNTSANLNGSGFFPDVKSAIQWGKLNYIWSNHTLYSKVAQLELSSEYEFEEIKL
ncbi:hypothetical protein AY601_2222 [Pedobacter cryoconitis]|uniref:Carbamoyltransferase n=1 Tax=Pedobacter cryoconitis TaxID=188932 RepID=A0A127VCZ3_9SPHI|nr:carbamoyltransferase N-terminal domain-containing protein [Pedobacter cryoconitis]AMP99119.1 hypothetical protein AY601_2222 [Pedobacter cryoconitis]